MSTHGVGVEWTLFEVNKTRRSFTRSVLVKGATTVLTWAEDECDEDECDEA